MTDEESTTLYLTVFDGAKIVIRHSVLWYNHNSRDFITRTLSWAARKGYVSVITNEVKYVEAAERARLTISATVFLLSPTSRPISL